MDQSGHVQPQSSGFVGTPGHFLFGSSCYQPNEMAGPSMPGQLTHQQHQLPYPQQIPNQQEEQLKQQLRLFWGNQRQEIEQVTDFKNHNLPLARIKKIMKADEDVRMISAEAPVVFDRACEMFILELTLRGWNHTEENKRRTLQKSDIVAAIDRTEVFDFLIDVVSRDDLKDDVSGVGPSDTLPYHYVPAQQGTQTSEAPPIMMGNPSLYPQQPYTSYIPQPIWPQASQEGQSRDENGF